MQTNLRTISLSLFTLSLLVGCNKDKAADSPVWPWGDSEIKNLQGCNTACSTTEMYQSVIAATSFCRQVSNFYEGTGNINSRTKLGVKVLGVLAGSVFGVTAGGTAAKAWSSLSGATNGIQTDLGDEALVRSNRARVISGLLDKFHTEIKDSLSTSTISDAERAKVVLASISVSGRCATYSQELPPDESAKMEEKVAAINKLVNEQLKTPEQRAADKLAAEKAAANSVAVDKAYAELKDKEAADAARKKAAGAAKP
ncbi:hypothetical protein [Pseudomonas sp. dw_612]|uniref:hypothetical protein n=1 Tax=Pseudomonas sp. dw_612 TaxID=2720080 RepID=UPI001BD1EE9F|nr:hypothetical protein [Pseudomonas sp. dw_612]